MAKKMEETMPPGQFSAGQVTLLRAQQSHRQGQGLVTDTSGVRTPPAAAAPAADQSSP